MKKILSLMMMFALIACAGCKKNEDEEFTPYPGGKCCDEKPK